MSEKCDHEFTEVWRTPIAFADGKPVRYLVTRYCVKCGLNVVKEVKP